MSLTLCVSSEHVWKKESTAHTYFTTITIVRVMVLFSVRFRFSWLENINTMQMQEFCCLWMPCIHHPYCVPSFLLLKPNKRKVSIKKRIKMNATKNEQQQMIQKTQSKWQTGSQLFELVLVYSVHDDGDTNINSSDRGCERWIWLRQYFLYEATTQIIIIKKENYTQLKSTAMLLVDLMV